MPPANKPPKPFVIGAAEKLFELPEDAVTALFELDTFPITNKNSSLCILKHSNLFDIKHV